MHRVDGDETRASTHRYRATVRRASWCWAWPWAWNGPSTTAANRMRSCPQSCFPCHRSPMTEAGTRMRLVSEMMRQDGEVSEPPDRTRTHAFRWGCSHGRSPLTPPSTHFAGTRHSARGPRHWLSHCWLEPMMMEVVDHFRCTAEWRRWTWTWSVSAEDHAQRGLLMLLLLRTRLAQTVSWRARLPRLGQTNVCSTNKCARSDIDWDEECGWRVGCQMVASKNIGCLCYSNGVADKLAVPTLDDLS